LLIDTTKKYALSGQLFCLFSTFANEGERRTPAFAGPVGRREIRSSPSHGNTGA
jgi:hypothetical protein